jgi:transposase
MAKNQLQFGTSTLHAVGIDVSKDNLMLCKKYSDGKKFVFEIRNRNDEIRKIARELKKEKYSGKIIVESTGRHHLPGALEMSRNGLDVRVINPLIANKYIKSSIRKIKTDKRDAEVLAEIAIKEEKLPQRFDSDENTMKIRKKVSLIATLDKQLQKLSAAMNEFIKTGEDLGLKLSITEKHIFKTIGILKEQKKELEKEVERLALGSKHKRDIAERYTSIPGVSAYLASLATLFFDEEGHSQSAKQWIAFAGMDISVRESGNWRGKGKLTKRGNGYLRKRLFQSAWGAVMHNGEFKEYYEYLRAKGKSYVESLMIIARKIIAIMFALSKNNCGYDNSKKLFTVNNNI